MRSPITQVLISQVSHRRRETPCYAIGANPRFRPLRQAALDQANSISRLRRIAQVVGFSVVAVSVFIVLVGCSESPQLERLSIGRTSVYRNRLSQAERHLVPGQYEEAVRAFEELLPQIAESSLERVVVLFGLGRAYFGREGLREGKFAGPDAYREDQRGAHDALQKALEQTQTVACRDRLMGLIHHSLGIVLRREGNFRGAVQHLGDAERLFQKSGHEQERGSALSVLILALLDAGDFSAVGLRCKELEALPQKKRDPHTQGTLGMAYMALGKLNEAAVKLDLARNFAAQDPAFRDDLRLKTELEINLAVHQQRVGQYNSAQQVLERILRQAADRRLDQRTIAIVEANLGRMYLGLERFDEAQKHLHKAQRVRRELLGEDHLESLRLLPALANLALKQAHLEDARVYCEKAFEGMVKSLGATHPDTANVQLMLASVLSKSSECPQALAHAREAVEVLDASCGRDHPRSVSACFQATLIAGDCRTTEQGVSEFARLSQEAELRFPLLRSKLGDDHPEVLTTLTLFAEVGALTPDTYEAALRRYRDAEKGRKRFVNDGAPSLAQLRLKQGRLLTALRRTEEAARMYDKACQLLDPSFHNHPVRADLLEALGDIHRAAGDAEKANAMYGEALGIFEQAYGVDHERVKAFLDRHRADL